MKTWPIAFQMWSLADLVTEDLPAAYKALAETGYSGVEGWFPTWPPADELRRMLDDAGLEMPSVHAGIRWMLDDLDGLCEYFDRVGVYRLVIPTTSFGIYPPETPWRKRIDDIAAIADRLAGTKFSLAFHNHADELTEQIDGRDVHDAIFESIPADRLQVQMDTYFVQHVGRRPADYIRRYAGRQELLHLKEKPADGSPYVNAEIGRGVIDWPEVFAAAEDAGVQWLIVEQKCQQHDPLTSARMSMDFLKACGAARPRQ